MATTVVTLGGRAVGTIEDVQTDQPWFEGTWHPLDGFEEVAPQIRECVEIVESGRIENEIERFEHIWEQLASRGLTLTTPDGAVISDEFVLYVYNDGTARYRY